MQNPLFPSSNPDDTSSKSAGDAAGIPDYLRTPSTTPKPTPKPRVIQPLPAEERNDAERNVAADLIRQKLAALYEDEPSAKREAAEVAAATGPLSRHQQYMQELQSSGRSPAEIQAAWHEYYAGLSDNDKHQVWQEFYAASQTAKAASPVQPEAAVTVTTDKSSYSPVRPAASPETSKPRAGKAIDKAAVADIKDRLLSTVKSRAQSPHLQALKPTKSVFQSLAFGIGCGFVVLVIFMFGFFNEVVISPFIQPSRTANETPVIVNPASATAGKDPKVIIPKINVEIPVDYSQTTTSSAAIETALDSAVVHHPTTVKPGQAGNTAFFGHSSNNIFNPGKYKFAFVLLHKLTEGDVFYLNYEGKTYAYEVISKRIVKPTEVGVLGPVEGQAATATLITCDPPGTSINRLVVVGKQISPDPSGNAAPDAGQPATPAPVTATDTNLPGNGPTLWGRIWDSIL